MKQDKLVQEIHDAFDDAQDLLLEQANTLIKEHKVTNPDHVSQLKKLGFVNTDVVKEADKKNKIAVTNAETVNLILYYKQEYPFLKFLTEEKLDEICGKYNLICAPVGNYEKDVPPKNLKEISGAQPRKKGDTLKTTWKITNAGFWNDSISNEIKDWTLTTAFEERPHASERWFREHCPHSLNVSYFLGIGCKMQIQAINKEGLFIAAPKSHFDLKDLEQKGKKGFFKTEVFEIEVKDPIVFRYVRGGIQVLSKWGLEANDPELANPLDN